MSSIFSTFFLCFSNTKQQTFEASCVFNLLNQKACFTPLKAYFGDLFNNVYHIEIEGQLLSQSKFKVFVSMQWQCNQSTWPCEHHGNLKPLQTLSNAMNSPCLLVLN